MRTSVVKELAQLPLLLALLAKLAIFHKRLERICLDVLRLIISRNLRTSETLWNVRARYDSHLTGGWLLARAPGSQERSLRRCPDRESEVGKSSQQG